MVTLPTYYICLICTAINSPPQGDLPPQGALFSPTKWPSWSRYQHTTFAWSVQQSSPRPREASRLREPFWVPQNGRGTVYTRHSWKSLYDVFVTSFPRLWRVQSSHRVIFSIGPNHWLCSPIMILQPNCLWKFRCGANWSWFHRINLYYLTIWLSIGHNH